MYSKKYTPLEVMDFIKNTLGPDFNELQDSIERLIAQVKVCEEHFHGVGEHSLIKESYDNLYKVIGGFSTDDFDLGTGFWGAAKTLSSLGNTIFNNAKRDEEIDNGEV